jgi:hypothetical protein
VPGVALWVVMYVASAWLNLACRRAYMALGGKYVVDEGYAMHARLPASARQLLSPHFMGRVMAYVLGLVTASAVDRELRAPGVFEFALGGAVLLQAAILRRGLRALFLFRSLPTSGAVGKLTYPRAHSSRASAVDLATFAALLLLLAVVLESPFCCGGFVACSWVAVSHYRQGKRAAAAAAATPKA